jgi:hypothetical protein
MAKKGSAAGYPDSIKRLMARFDQQSDPLRSSEYNERIMRIDFINPLRTALGWHDTSAK